MDEAFILISLATEIDSDRLVPSDASKCTLVTSKEPFIRTTTGQLCGGSVVDYAKAGIIWMKRSVCAQF